MSEALRPEGPLASRGVAEGTLRSESSQPAPRTRSEPGSTAQGSGVDHVLPIADVPATLRFRDSGEIARGGMGSVRRVYDTVLRREVAMKLGDPSTPGYAQAALRFMEEAQITGQLDHPNIVPVHDLGTGTEGVGVYFTMKLVDGETLTEIMRRLHVAEYDHRAIEKVLQVFLKICDALSFAHARGVVHRDLKPDNVMVGAYGQVYVMDWGVALLQGSLPRAEAPAAPHVTLSDDLFHGTREEAGSIVGTFEYMAPEQAWGRTDDIDERTDVFGLGGILYHLLTREGPNASGSSFECLQRAQRGKPEPPDTRGAWSTLPPGLCRIAMKALAKAKEDRYPTVVALKEDVEDFLRGGGWFDTRVFPAGSAIVTEGEAADAAYIIASGECEVWKGEGERRALLRQLGPGDVFGETAVLTGEARSATVVASCEVTVKIVTRDALERELGQKAWAGAFVKALAQRFRAADEQLAQLRR